MMVRHGPRGRPAKAIDRNEPSRTSGLGLMGSCIADSDNCFTIVRISSNCFRKKQLIKFFATTGLYSVVPETQSYTKTQVRDVGEERKVGTCTSNDDALGLILRDTAPLLSLLCSLTYFAKGLRPVLIRQHARPGVVDGWTGKEGRKTDDARKED